jgi:hypothetical protein
MVAPTQKSRGVGRPPENVLAILQERAVRDPYRGHGPLLHKRERIRVIVGWKASGC